MTLVINFTEEQMNLFGAVIGMVASAGCKFEVLNNQPTAKSAPVAPAKVAEAPKTIKEAEDFKVYFVERVVKDGRKVVAKLIDVKDKDAKGEYKYCYPKDVRKVANTFLKGKGFHWDAENKGWTADDKAYKAFDTKELVVTAKERMAVRANWDKRRA